MIQLVHNILGRTKTRLDLWEEHLKDPIIALEKNIILFGAPPLELTSGSKILLASRVGCSGLRSCGYQDFAKDVGRARLGRRLALPGPVGQVCACKASTFWNVPGMCGPHGGLFFFLVGRETPLSLRKRSRRVR